MPQLPKLDLKPIEESSTKLDLQPLDLQEQDPITDAKKFLDTTDSISNPIDNIQVHQQEPGWLERTWKAISEPLTNRPSEIASDIGSWIDQRHLDENPHLAYGKGLIHGGLQGVGDLVSGLTSPINALTTAATMGESGAIKAGMGGLAKVLNLVSKGASIPTAIHGVSDVYNESTLAGKGKGLAELAGGLAGVMHSPSTTPIRENVLEETRPTDILDHLVQPESVNTQTGEIFDPISAPNEAGIPQFGGKGKQTGSRQIGEVVSIKPGEFDLSQVQDMASNGYKYSHQSPNGEYVFQKTGEPTITETGVGETRPTVTSERQQLGPQTDTKKKSTTAEILNLPRAIMASTDMSAPLRQGLPLIHKKEWWGAIPDMFRAFGSEEAFQSIQKSIADKPLFKKRVSKLNDGTIKELPSFAEDAGLKLTDLHDLSNREEALMSSWAEKIPGFGPQLYRRSERAYTAFLNKLRADTFESLIGSSKVLGVNGETNIPLARGLADFVNTATGRGSLGSLERSAVALNSTFFAPRLIASRLKMLNPVYYITADPIVRKEALKSLLAVAAVGNTMGQLARMSGVGTVESDPTSSDFGKIKIGNTRIDPFAGFQQYVVAANRLIQGRMKSTTSGNEYDLSNPKFGRPSRLDVAERFAESKLNPMMTMAIDLLRGKDFTGQPVNIPEEVASRFVPIFIQDLKQLATENPNLLPNLGQQPDNESNYDFSEFDPAKTLGVGALNFFGMGSQTYKSKQ